MNTTRAISREEATLNSFLDQPRERWLDSCYVAEGPLYFAVMAINIAPPSKWKTIRVNILQRLLLTAHSRSVSFIFDCPPVSKASREVANLTEKKSNIPVYGVKEFVCLSVTNFDPNYLTGRTEWAEIFKDNFG